MHLSFTLLALAALHGGLLGLPAVPAALLARRVGARHPTELCIAGLSGIGILAYAAFWIYLANPAAGRLFDYFSYGACAAVLVACLWRKRDIFIATLRPLARPAALSWCWSVLVLAAGLAPGGSHLPLSSSTVRFSHQLPSDNALPWFFALQLVSKARPLPHFLVPGWLSSDRPPLQAAVVVSQWPSFGNAGSAMLHYEVLCVLLQGAWVFGLFVLLESLELSRLPRALAMSVAMISPVAIVQGFYVWPKLFPAGYLLCLAAVVIGQRGVLRGAGARLGAIFGIGAGLAMLGHMGSAYGLVALGVAALVLRRLPRPAFLATMVGSLGLTMVPWFAYKAFYDPPGDRLFKWQLAGVTAVTKSGALQAILHAYHSLSLSQYLTDKWSNVVTLVGGGSGVLGRGLGVVGAYTGFVRSLFDFGPASSSHRLAAAAALRSIQFFHLFPNIGLASLAPVAILVAFVMRRRTREMSAASRMWLLVVVILPIWCLLDFLPRSTVVHDGTLFTETLAIPGGVLALWGVSKILAAVAAVIQVGLESLAYFAIGPVPSEFHAYYSPDPYLWFVALAVGLVIVGILGGRGRASERPEETTGELAEASLEEATAPQLTEALKF